MKLLRILLLILILFIAVVLLAVGSLLYFVDPQKMAVNITKAIDKKTGYHVTMDGKLSWSFYPIFGINISHMSLSAPQQTIPFADLSDVRIATELSQIIHGQEKLKGQVSISKVRLMNMHLQNVQVQLHWKDKIITLDPITANLYNGSLVGTAHGSELSLNPKWDWNVTLKDIQLKPLLEDINTGNKIKIAGVGQVKFQAVTQGNNREQFLNHLNGTLSYRVDQGVVEGVDLNYLVQTADAIINSQPVPASPSLNQTEFASLVGSAVIKQGIADINNVVLTSPVFTTKGEGDINLPNQTINLQLEVAPQQSLKTQWLIPISITGPLDHPNVLLNTHALTKWMMEQDLNKVEDKVRDEMKEIKEKAGQFMQRVLGH